jgi:deoxyadenosine/deoxycytidine kinase
LSSTKYCFETNYVAFEGNIGAGKTTLATKEDFNAKQFGTFCGQSLPFYKDQNRYAFPLEMSFYDRYQQLSDDLAQFDLFKDF